MVFKVCSALGQSAESSHIPSIKPSQTCRGLLIANYIFFLLASWPISSLSIGKLLTAKQHRTHELGARVSKTSCKRGQFLKEYLQNFCLALFYGVALDLTNAVSGLQFSNVYNTINQRHTRLSAALCRVKQDSSIHPEIWGGGGHAWSLTRVAQPGLGHIVFIVRKLGPLGNQPVRAEKGAPHWDRRQQWNRPCQTRHTSRFQKHST